MKRRVTGIDSLAILDQAFEAVRTFVPLTSEKMMDLLQRTQKAAADGAHERFKTTPQFDSTAQNPQWMS